jgi:hypothetical protein
MKNKDYYEGPRGCEHKAVMIIVAVVILLIVILSCERTQAGGWDECCWICKIKTTYYKPQPGIAEISVTTKFADSVYCDCTDEFITAWEIANSSDTTINGFRTKQEAKCYK